MINLWNKVKDKINNKKELSSKELVTDNENLTTNNSIDNLPDDITLLSSDNVSSEDTNIQIETGSLENNNILGTSSLLPDIIREPIFVMPENLILENNNSNQSTNINYFFEIINRVKDNKILAAGLSCVILIICTSLIYASTNNKDIEIQMPDKKTVKVSISGSVTTAEALEKANITLSPHEHTSLRLDENLSDGDKIVISKPKEVLVAAKKKTVKIKTPLDSTNEIVKQAGIKVPKNFKIKKIEKDNLKVYGVVAKNEKLKYETKKIKRKTIYKEVDEIKGGKEEKVVKKGSTGEEKLVKIVSYDKKGKKKKSTVVYKKVVKKASPRVIHISKDSTSKKVVSSNKVITFNKKGQKMTVNVTAYCACMKCCGKTNGITASGTKATAGRTVAASSAFPFGTKLYFPYFKNNGNGGVFVVEDRGGAITSGRIDIYFDSHSAALAFGRRTLEMYIVK